jgi:hypothetical protein
MHLSRALITLSALACATIASAAPVTLVRTSDPGFYNNSIGTVLNGTNGGETGPFPVGNDGSYRFATAPDLTAANAALGNWLTNPLALNANWHQLASIPNGWAVGSEVAVMYEFDTLSATNVIARFGVDNGIFVWLDGNYVFGARDPGSFSVGEYTLQLGDLSSGTHFLQLLLEDHGATNGYAVNITADTFIPGPPPGQSVPEPTSMALVGLGLAFAGLGVAKGRGDKSSARGDDASLTRS